MTIKRQIHSLLHAVLAAWVVLSAAACKTVHAKTSVSAPETRPKAEPAVMRPPEPCNIRYRFESRGESVHVTARVVGANGTDRWMAVTRAKVSDFSIDRERPSATINNGVMFFENHRSEDEVVATYDLSVPWSSAVISQAAIVGDASSLLAVPMCPGGMSISIEAGSESEPWVSKASLDKGSSPLMPHDILSSQIIAAPEIETGEFEAGGQRDEIFWTGFLGYDQRWILAETSIGRSRIGSFLGAVPLGRLLLLLASSPQVKTPIVLESSRSITVGLPENAAWATVRIAVASSIVHQWLGSLLEEAPTAEGGGWLTDGVARWVATSAYAQAGLLSPEEFADEINGWLSSGVSLSQRRSRGALFAAYINVRAREKTGNGLRTLLRTLVNVALEQKRPVTLKPEDLLAAMGSSATGPDADRATGILERPQIDVLPGNAFGRCFEKKNVTMFEEVGARWDEVAGKIRAIAVVERGAAFRAGIREGDIVERVETKGSEVVVDVRREAGVKTLVVERKSSKVAQFVRRRAVAAELCFNEP